MRFDQGLLRLYENAPLRYKLYTCIRWAICPFLEIEKHVHPGARVLDLGCGHGIFANLLAIRSGRRHIIGLDIMANKIDVAKNTLRARKNLEFRVGDLQDIPGGKVIGIDCFTLIDTLCYIPYEEKRRALEKIYSALQPGGMLIVKCIYESPRWKYWCTLFHMAVIDKLMHRGFTANSYFLKKNEYIKLLEAVGFKVDFKDIGRGYPYSHCLYVCTKKSNEA